MRSPSPAQRRLLLACLPALALAACSWNAPPPYYAPARDADADTSLYRIPAGATPDGTLSLTIARGATAARGTLMTNTLRYPVTIQGLSAPGATRPVQLTGQVFGLGRTDQIAGTYKVVNTTASDEEPAMTGGLQLGNENLVVMRLMPSQPGQDLAMPPEGVSVTLQR